MKLQVTAVPPVQEFVRALLINGKYHRNWVRESLQVGREWEWQCFYCRNLCIYERLYNTGQTQHDSSTQFWIKNNEVLHFSECTRVWIKIVCQFSTLEYSEGTRFNQAAILKNTTRRTKCQIAKITKTRRYSKKSNPTKNLLLKYMCVKTQVCSTLYSHAQLSTWARDREQKVSSDLLHKARPGSLLHSNHADVSCPKTWGSLCILLSNS